MSSKRSIAGTAISLRGMYCAIILVILIGFAGKIYLFSVYGSSASKKCLSGYVNNTTDQEDGDDKEDSKSAEKNLPYYLVVTPMQLSAVSQKVSVSPFQLYISHFVDPHFLTVPTPPPNC